LAGAIVQSGATFATLDVGRAALVREIFAKEVGVAELAELRTVDVEELMRAQAAAMSALLQPVGMMPFHPMVDGDVLLDRPDAALAAGVAAGVSLIAGTTADEMALFVDRSAPPPPREKLVRRVGRYLAFDDSSAEAVVAAYARSIGSDDTAAIWLAVFGDNEMQVPCGAIVDAQSAHAPTFTYLFTWAGPGVGACHAIDIPFTFGNFVDGWEAFVGADDDARELSRLLRSAWGAFARTGSPGWAPAPAAMIFGRESHAVAAHPLFARVTQTRDAAAVR
jgi:para-nitrobenzyl esterase